MATINKILQLSNEFADNHEQVFDWGTGEPWEIGRSSSLQYLTLWAMPIESRPIRTQSGYLYKEIIIQYIAMDIVSDDDTNLMEVISDTEQVLTDLIVEIDQNPYYGNNQIILEGNPVITAFSDRENDHVAGNSVELTFRTPIDTSYCGKPNTPKS